jgi:signal transduction histidine kinase
MNTPDWRGLGLRNDAIRQLTANRRWLVDGGLALAVTAADVGLTYASQAHQQATSRPDALAYALLVIGGLALLARRRYPVTVLAIALVTALVASAQNAGSAYLALIVAFFTAILARKRAAAVASLLIGYVASVWPPWLIGQHGHTKAGFALGLAAGLLFLLSVAEVIRIRAQRAAALTAGRAEELRRRASEERLRIARELHDVVAHNISVINVQANTALHLMDRQPDRARSALTTINEVSKQALVELRSVLGVLRDVDAQAPRAPAPGLARLGDLVSHAAAAGLTVRVEEDGPRPRLPADVDLAAYRIVQEAVTNSARHSGGQRATIRLASRPGGLEIQVDDDGLARPAGSPPLDSGNGILGMTERATALGGTLTAGPRAAGGFRVLAWLPVTPLAGPDPQLTPSPAAPGPAPATPTNPARTTPARPSAPQPAPRSAPPGGSR